MYFYDYQHLSTISYVMSNGDACIYVKKMYKLVCVFEICHKTKSFLENKKHDK